MKNWDLEGERIFHGVESGPKGQIWLSGMQWVPGEEDIPWNEGSLATSKDERQAEDVGGRWGVEGP